MSKENSEWNRQLDLLKAALNRVKRSSSLADSSRSCREMQGSFSASNRSASTQRLLESSSGPSGTASASNDVPWMISVYDAPPASPCESLDNYSNPRNSSFSTRASSLVPTSFATLTHCSTSGEVRTTTSGPHAFGFLRRTRAAAEDDVDGDADAEPSPAVGVRRRRTGKRTNELFADDLLRVMPDQGVLRYLRQSITNFRRVWRHLYKYERHWNAYVYNFRHDVRSDLSKMCLGYSKQSYETLCSYFDNKLDMKIHTGTQRSKRRRNRGGSGRRKFAPCLSHTGFRRDYEPDGHDLNVMREIQSLIEPD